jgi:cell division protein FtsB
MKKAYRLQDGGEWKVEAGMRRKVGKRKKRGVVLKLLLCAFVVYSAINLVKISIDVREKRETLATLNESVERQTVENETMKSAIQKGMTQDEVEKISRDKLDLASPNERVFINIDG